MQIGWLISEASTALNDADETRWPASELIGHLNTMLTTLATLRPVAFETTGNITLVAGAKQSVPSTASRLLTVVRNMAANGTTTGAAVLPMSKSALDLHSPAWWSDTESGAIENYAYDPEKNPDIFYVYPPAIVGTIVEASYSTRLVQLTDPMEPLPVNDEYAPALLDGILARAFMKNSELAEVQKAQAHYQAFFAGIGFATSVAEKMAGKAIEDS